MATAQRKASRVKVSLGKASLCLENSSASSSAKRPSKKALQHHLGLNTRVQNILNCLEVI